MSERAVKAGIIDYGGGNLRSVENALRAVGHVPEIISSPEQASKVTHLVLPGQGEFGDCMRRLRNTGLADFLKNWIENDHPYFGICVGYQILFDGSDEAPEIPGLGITPGRVRRFSPTPGLSGVKIPHMGWNSAQLTDPRSPIWNGLSGAPYFYFVHSYFPEPVNRTIIAAETQYGNDQFAAAIAYQNLFACQFHAEKSQAAGLRLLENFLNYK